MTAVPLVHAVTDDRVLGLPDFLDRARALALGPDIAIQLRGRLPGGPLLRLADRLRDLTSATGARLVIHDRPDVARLCGAHGVHLPRTGLPVPRTREILRAGVLVGRSVHAADEALAAHAEGADYVFLGNIWPTASHPGRPGLGPDAITRARPAPVVAIGGITPETAAAARRAGAIGVAAIRWLWDSADPGAAARTLRLSCSV